MDEDVGMEIVGRYLGTIIDRIIERNGFKIDIEDEYEELLYYIYERLSRLWFKSHEPGEEEFEEKIRYIKRRKRLQLEILLSYLVSKYVQSKTTLTIYPGKDSF